MKILITDRISPEGVLLLKNEGFEVAEKYELTPEELIKTIPEYDALIVRSATKVTKEVIEAGKNLKVIGRAGVGLDNIDTETAKSKNIVVLNTPAATSVSVAELAFALMLACARPIVKGTLSLREGRWEKKAMHGTELFGKTLGIIGFGRIGTELAKRAKAFGMRVLAYSRRPKSSDVAEQTDLNTLLSQSDYISIHTPKTAETTHMISREAIAKMKHGVVIINCARGGVVDEEALYEALMSGKVHAAGLDVFETEPPKDTKLVTIENVVATPHIGAQTEEGQQRAGVEIAKLVADTLKKL